MENYKTSQTNLGSTWAIWVRNTLKISRHFLALSISALLILLLAQAPWESCSRYDGQ